MQGAFVALAVSLADLAPRWPAPPPPTTTTTATTTTTTTTTDSSDLHNNSNSNSMQATSACASAPSEPLGAVPQQQEDDLMYEMPQMYGAQHAVRRVVHPGTEPADAGLELAAVVLTVKGSLSDSSYDEVFQTVVPVPEAGTRVAVFEATFGSLAQVLQATAVDTAPDAPTIYEELGAEIRAVPAEAVVLNFECCQCCSERGFEATAPDKEALWRAIEFFVGRGSFVMASDFSLKALIAEWREPALGPCPFVQLPAACESSFDLSFDPSKLKACPSTQLATVGELATNGHAHSHALGGTILYALDDAKAEQAKRAGAAIDVLTVAPKIDGRPAERIAKAAGVSLSKAGGKKGLPGHVLLSFPGGGRLLTSMGHWMELVELDTTEESLLAAAESRSMDFQRQLQCSLVSSRTEEERSEVVQRYTAQVLSSAAPCTAQRSRRSAPPRLPEVGGGAGGAMALSMVAEAKQPEVVKPKATQSAFAWMCGSGSAAAAQEE